MYIILPLVDFLFGNGINIHFFYGKFISKNIILPQTNSN